MVPNKPDSSNEKASDVKPKEHYPLFKDYDEALAYCEKTGDNYYATAFLLEFWIGNLVIEMSNKYADLPPKKRNMQNGEAFGHFVFKDLFSNCDDPKELLTFIRHLLRFSEEEDTYGELVRRSINLFGEENGVIPVVDMNALRPGPSALIQMRLYVRRFCDWFDALLQSNAHFMYYHAPGAYHPGDEEARHLFTLGIGEGAMPHLSGYDQQFWRWNHESALHRLSNPSQWKFLADGVKNEGKRHQAHPEVDEFIIVLWPLMKRFNWSYNELLTVLEQALPHYVGRYPCDLYSNLQKHCLQALGLKKGTGDTRGPAGKSTSRYEQCDPPMPEGFEIVKAFIAKRDAARRQAEGR